MTHLKITMFSTRSLASLESAESVYDIFDKWDCPPTAFDEYEPIRSAWSDRARFLDAWENQARRNFGQVLIQRKGKVGYLAHSIFQFGPNVTYHGFSVYRIKESDCSGPRLEKIINLADDIFAELNLDYGFICLSEEYDAKNIVKNVRHPNGTIEPRKVVGMNWPACIPGLYWINYFGQPYLAEGFAAGVHETDSTTISNVGNGVRIQAGLTPRWFELDCARRSEERLKCELGETWFHRSGSDVALRSIDAPAGQLRSPA